MYSYINNKYNRMLYFLLGFYIILVFVFSLLLNGFFVKPKAFSNGTSYIISYSMIAYDNANCTTDVRSDWSGNSRYIFYSDTDFKELISNKMSGRLNSDVDVSCIRISKTNQPSIYGGSVTDTVVSQIGPYSAKAQNMYSMPFDSDIRDYFSQKGYTFNDVQGYPYYVDFVVNGGNINGNKSIGGELLTENVQYIDSPENLYKFMVENNDDVVKNGDPESPEVDSQIPTPQKVAIYKNSDSPTLVWANPKGVSGNNSVGVEIEWKPTLVLTQNLYDVRTITSNEYIDLYKGELLDYNSYCVLLNRDSSPPNVLNSYNTLYDSKPIYSGYNDNYTDDWTDYLIDLNGITNVQRINPLEPSNIFAAGTYSGTRVPELSYRIRYYTQSGVSDWVYSGRTYDSDNVSGPSQHSSTHFKNASGDSVSNPTYTPNNDNKVIPQNEIDDQDNPDKQKSNSIFDFISGFFDTIISAISAIFDKLKELVDSISNGTGSFFSFFADLFGAFPQLLGIFLLGLVVTVLLRVLGR